MPRVREEPYGCGGDASTTRSLPTGDLCCQRPTDTLKRPRLPDNARCHGKEKAYRIAYTKDFGPIEMTWKLQWAHNGCGRQATAPTWTGITSTRQLATECRGCIWRSRCRPIGMQAPSTWVCSGTNGKATAFAQGAVQRCPGLRQSPEAYEPHTPRR